MLEGLGFPKPDVKYIASQYKDLVVTIKLGNREVKVGEKYPLTTKFTIVVGKGMDYQEVDSLDIEF